MLVILPNRSLYWEYDVKIYYSLFIDNLNITNYAANVMLENLSCFSCSHLFYIWL